MQHDGLEPWGEERHPWARRVGELVAAALFRLPDPFPPVRRPIVFDVDGRSSWDFRRLHRSAFGIGDWSTVIGRKPQPSPIETFLAEQRATIASLDRIATVARQLAQGQGASYGDKLRLNRIADAATGLRQALT